MSSFIEVIAFNFETIDDFSNFQVLFPKFSEKLHIVSEYRTNELLFINFVVAETEFFRNGNKALEEFYNRNGKNGIIRHWYTNGQIESEETYVDGVKGGPGAICRPNGRIKSTYSYRNNKLNGEMISYYNNGQNSVEGKYSNGRKVGLWTYYNLDGTIDHQERFEE